MAYQKINERT